MALRHVPARMDRVLDIGCDDGYLLLALGPSVPRREGIEPRLAAASPAGCALVTGRFPADAAAQGLTGPYDAVFALAVFEHFTDTDLRACGQAIPKLLSGQGRLIVTVPHPWVDRILDALIFLRVLDGTAVEEHHGFDPASLPGIFSELKLVAHERFQLGLNNVFVFEGK